MEISWDDKVNKVKLPSSAVLLEGPSGSLPSVRSLAVVDLSFNVPGVIVIASNHIPGDMERLGSENSLKGFLKQRLNVSRSNSCYHVPFKRHQFG